MPYTKSGLWIPRDLKQQLAEKPHWITVSLTLAIVSLSLISGLVASLGVYISLRALRQSTNAQIQLHQAYISISNFAVKLEDNEYKITFEVINSGNTPAYDTRVTCAIMLPKGKVVRVGNSVEHGVYNPKESSPMSFIIPTPPVGMYDNYICPVAFITQYKTAFNHALADIHCLPINIKPFRPCRLKEGFESFASTLD